MFLKHLIKIQISAFIILNRNRKFIRFALACLRFCQIHNFEIRSFLARVLKREFMKESFQPNTLRCSFALEHAYFYIYDNHKNLHNLNSQTLSSMKHLFPTEMYTEPVGWYTQLLAIQ